MKTYHEEQIDWRKALDDSLKKEDGWLALAGLFWLEAGENTFGTDPDNDFVLDVSSGPGRIGSFILDEKEVTLKVLENQDLLIDGEIKKEMVIKADSSGSPTEIKLDHLSFMLLDREDGLAIRLWDNQKPERLNFGGRLWMPIEDKMRIRGTFIPYAEEKEMVFSRKNGDDFCTSVQGEVKLDLEGEDYSLIAFEQEDGSLFIMFFDGSTGNETYSAGRYLIIDPPLEGGVEVDFNRAYNPPCAFTDFATCPLPPMQNRIEGKILAGEKI